MSEWVHLLIFFQPLASQNWLRTVEQRCLLQALLLFQARVKEKGNALHAACRDSLFFLRRAHMHSSRP